MLWIHKECFSSFLDCILIRQHRIMSAKNDTYVIVCSSFGTDGNENSDRGMSGCRG